jgi:hypothetical protein
MDHPIRVAFCPILFAVNGGRFTDKGLPIFQEKDEDGYSPRGKCDRAFDCGVCPHLTAWVNQFAVAGWSVGWECNACLKNTAKSDAEERLDRLLPGYYQSGRDPDDENPFPEMPGFDNKDADRPPLHGCTRCGWQSSFLQLIMRRPSP